MARLVCLAGLLCLGLLSTVSATAQGRSLTLAADQRLAETGFLKYLLPRFSLKHGLRVTLAPAPAEALTGVISDVVLAPSELAGTMQARGRVRAAFHVEGGAAWSVVVMNDAEAAENAAEFAGWLTSEIGQRTVAGFEAEGQPTYLPGALKIEREVVDLPEGDADEGEKLAILHCGRCHVISEANRFGGIGSTPSFMALRTFEDWEDKFTTFWQLNPHPSFTQVEGLTEPFDPARPPHIAPILMTMEDLEAIVAFTARIEEKDLGAEINAR